MGLCSQSVSAPNWCQMPFITSERRDLVLARALSNFVFAIESQSTHILIAHVHQTACTPASSHKSPTRGWLLGLNYQLNTGRPTGSEWALLENGSNSLARHLIYCGYTRKNCQSISDIYPNIWNHFEGEFIYCCLKASSVSCIIFCVKFNMFLFTWELPMRTIM